MTDVPTTLLLNGRVHSPSHPDATAMAVRDGAVAWLGSDDVGRDQFAGAEVVDLDGGFVAPAFVDSHVHLTATGLDAHRSRPARRDIAPHCLRLIADYAAAHPGEPIWGHGWDESSWPENTAPTTADLDAVLGDRPAYLARVDVHSALASTGLRQACRRTGVGDRIRRTAAAGRRRPPPGPRRRAWPADRGATCTRPGWPRCDAAAANGIVAVHECAGPQIGGLDDWHELRALSAAPTASR